MPPFDIAAQDEQAEPDVCFMEVSGNLMEKMFAGRLPMPGEVCELVCVKTDPGHIKFQLRVVDKREKDNATR